MYEIKIVTGRNDDGTTYDEENVIRVADESAAIREALTLPGTKDVLRPEGELLQPVARVHVDGGVDWYGKRGA